MGARRASRPARRPRRLVALTGTPGTGKSAVARALRREWPSIEVGPWAASIGAARKIRGGYEVDLVRLRRSIRRASSAPPAPLLVGHLSHLLPVDDVIVLRCHPEELRRRLARGHRGTPGDRAENYVAEAIDVILLEAVRPGRRVYEIDTTARTVRDVARKVAQRLKRRGPSDYGRVDWLSDATVTEHILARSR
jgi:adenylate kinase